MDNLFRYTRGDSFLAADPDLKKEIDKILLVCDVIISRQQIENVVLFEHAYNTDDRIALYKLYLYNQNKEVMLYLVLDLKNKQVVIMPNDPVLHRGNNNTTPVMFSYAAVLSMFLIFSRPFNPKFFLGIKIPIEGEI